MIITDHEDMHKKIKLRGQKTSTKCIKSKDRKTDIREVKLIQRWKEQIEELFHDENEQQAIHRNIEGPEI